MDIIQAEKYYNQALEIRQLIFNGDTSPPITQTMNNLSSIILPEEYIKAEEFYK